MILLILLLCLSLGAPVAAAATPASSPIAACRASFEAAPDRQEAAACFYRAARSQNLWSEVRSELESLHKNHPHNAWLLLALGQVRAQDSPATAEQLFGEAIDRFRSEKNLRGESMAHFGLRRVLTRQGKNDEAQQQLKRGTTLAEASGDPILQAYAKVDEARFLRESGGDLGKALRLLQQAAQTLLPDAPYELRIECLLALGNIHFVLDRRHQAMRYYRALAEETHAVGDSYYEALARLNIVLLFLSEQEEMLQPNGRSEAIRLAREALKTAHAAGSHIHEGRIHLILARLLTGPDARPHFDRCLEIARRWGTEAGQSECLRYLARRLAQTDPAAAYRTIDEASRIALEGGSRWEITAAIAERMLIDWEVGRDEEARKDGALALDAIETMRDVQVSTADRAGIFATWSNLYYLHSGHFLLSHEGGDEPALDEGFRVMERLRSRLLLAALDAAHATPSVRGADPLRKKRAEILEQISEVQRRLLDSRLSKSQRQHALQQLDRLEVEEGDAHSRLLLLDPRQGALERPPVAGLDDVRQALAPDEALLSFQIAAWKDVYDEFNGGSWLVVVTRGGTSLYRLPDPARLGPAVRLFLGLIERRDGSEADAAAHLYKDLLSEALASLPPEVDRLVVVPDGPLHHLPFASLRPAPNRPPLATRYHISRVPSATLWLRWRRQTAGARPRREALVLADPLLPSSSERRASTRQWSLARGAHLGALPEARAEGRAVARHLGDRALLLTDRKASESFVKGTDLERFGLLHFAAHAINDEDHPERSAILLAPGTPTEDGLLQIREIVDLPLAGEVVVLSACDTASGAVLRGEGVMGLARAFFQAGANTVVGSLWPLRDDDAAGLFDAFYRHLGDGESVGEALAAAQRDRLANGAPGAAWAGVVALGDADVIPFPGGVPHPLLRRPLLAAAFLATTLLLVVALVAFRRRSALHRPAGADR